MIHPFYIQLKNNVYYFYIILFLFLSVGCHRSKRRVPCKEINERSYCVPLNKYLYNPEFLPYTNIDSVVNSDPFLKSVIPEKELLIANSTGTLVLLKKMLSFRRDSSYQGRYNYQVLNNAIENQLLLSGFQISAISSELDCEGERAGQLASCLDDLKERRNRKYTAASIIIGSVSIALSGINKNNSVNNGHQVVVIIGGLISAVLGGITALPYNRKIYLEHERNLLEDIWKQSDTSQFYPPMVWYILNSRIFSNTKVNSIADNIKQRWIKLELGEKEYRKMEGLYFGKGGYYTAEQLHKRADMLNQLQSEIRSIYQELQSYMLTIDKLKRQE